MILACLGLLAVVTDFIWYRIWDEDMKLIETWDPYSPQVLYGFFIRNHLTFDMVFQNLTRAEQILVGSVFGFELYGYIMTSCCRAFALISSLAVFEITSSMLARCQQSRDASSNLEV